MDAGIFKDRIGEDTAPSDCALCHAVSCFSCVQGFCTALEIVTTSGCIFYKDTDENFRQIRKCFYRLISRERFDLLRKYADTMAALGLMEKELQSAAQQRDRLKQYGRKHLESLLASNWKGTLIVIRPADAEVEIEEEKQTESEPDPVDPESEFDNDLDKAVFPETATSESLDDEAADDIDARDKDPQKENARFTVDGVMESVSDPAPDELPPDYAEDFTEPMSYEEAIERAEEIELAKEAEQEKADLNAAAECKNFADGMCMASPGTAAETFARTYGYIFVSINDDWLASH